MSYRQFAAIRYASAILTHNPPTSGASGWAFYSALAAALVGIGTFCDLATQDGPAQPLARLVALNTEFKERFMKQDPVKDQSGKGQHGPASEVSWNNGEGRQPYANQGPQEAGQTGGGEFSEGDRGELSGRNLEQLDQVRKKP